MAFLGLLECRRGRLDEAHSIYARLAELHPMTELRPHVLLSLAYCAGLLGQRQEAINEYARFLKEFPKHEDAGFARSESQRLRRLRTQSIGR